MKRKRETGKGEILQHCFTALEASPCARCSHVVPGNSNLGLRPRHSVHSIRCAISRPIQKPYFNKARKMKTLHWKGKLNEQINFLNVVANGNDKIVLLYKGGQKMIHSAEGTLFQATGTRLKLSVNIWNAHIMECFMKGGTALWYYLSLSLSVSFLSPSLLLSGKITQ